MSLHTYNNVQQGTDEWLELRRGIVTASTVGHLLTYEPAAPLSVECPECKVDEWMACISLARRKSEMPKSIKTPHAGRAAAAAAKPAELKAANNDTSRRHTLTLVAERITGEIEPVWVNDDMERGHNVEPIARALYAKTSPEPVTETGFMVRDDWGFRLGYSPDGLVGDHGLIEVKAPRAKGHVATHLSQQMPSHHMAQVQAGLLVSGREWCDFISYHGGLPPFVQRIHANAKWAEAIVDAVSAFEQRAEEMTHTWDVATRDLEPTAPISFGVELKLA